MLTDTVRLATQIGDLSTAQAIAHRAALARRGPEIPHRQADALYCRGLLDHDASRLLAAADRYRDATRPLKRAQALEAAAREFVSTGELGQARATFTHAVDAYTALGATEDVALLQAAVPGPRHPARAARKAPARGQWLGQPHANRDQSCRAR